MENKDMLLAYLLLALTGSSACHAEVLSGQANGVTVVSSTTNTTPGQTTFDYNFSVGPEASGPLNEFDLPVSGFLAAWSIPQGWHSEKTDTSLSWFADAGGVNSGGSVSFRVFGNEGQGTAPAQFFTGTSDRRGATVTLVAPVAFAPVPEPSGAAVLVTGLGVLVCLGVRKRKQ